jgi:predicted acyl esterase
MPQRCRNARPSLIALLLLLSAPPSLLAQGLEYVKAHYIKSEHKIPMRDGRRLFTAVYVPRDTTRK